MTTRNRQKSNAKKQQKDSLFTINVKLLSPKLKNNNFSTLKVIENLTNEEKNTIKARTI